MSALSKSTFQKMFEAAVLCRERGLDIPMLVLVYTSLDTLAWAVYGEDTKSVRDRFVSLCETYVLPTRIFLCTAIELYAARCSILHSLGWESNLSRDGKARSVFYSFGTSDPFLAQQAYERSHPGKFVAVRADELLKAAQTAVALVAAQAQTDTALARRLANAAGKQYMSMESAVSDSLYSRFLSAEGAAREDS